MANCGCRKGLASGQTRRPLGHAACSLSYLAAVTAKAHHQTLTERCTGYLKWALTEMKRSRATDTLRSYVYSDNQYLHWLPLPAENGFPGDCSDSGRNVTIRYSKQNLIAGVGCVYRRVRMVEMNQRDAQRDSPEVVG